MTTLFESKESLETALQNLKTQADENQSNEKRLTQAQQEEAHLLGAQMDEGEQVEKLGRCVALQKLLASRIEAGGNRLEALKVDLRDVANARYDVFGNALTELSNARRDRHFSRLKELVAEAQWPYAEPHALAFIRFASDMVPLNLLDNSGEQTHRFLTSGAVLAGAKRLLEDIAKLEAEGSV